MDYGSEKRITTPYTRAMSTLDTVYDAVGEKTRLVDDKSEESHLCHNAVGWGVESYFVRACWARSPNAHASVVCYSFIHTILGGSLVEKRYHFSPPMIARLIGVRARV